MDDKRHGGANRTRSQEPSIHCEAKEVNHSRLLTYLGRVGTAHQLLFVLVGSAHPTRSLFSFARKLLADAFDFTFLQNWQVTVWHCQNEAGD